MRGVTGRRRFLELAAGASAALVGTRCGGGGPAAPVVPTASGPEPRPGDGSPIVTPRVNGGINVQPLRRLDFEFNEGDPVILPGLVAAQLQAVYELGFDGIRVTAGYGDRANFLAAIPYVRAARALGIDAVVVLANFSGFQLARALGTTARAPRFCGSTTRCWPRRRCRCAPAWVAWGRPGWDESPSRC
jgi:hypothetical protein